MAPCVEPQNAEDAVRVVTRSTSPAMTSRSGFPSRGKAMALTGVTQVNLANALGLTQPVSDVARGRYPDGMGNARKFASYFGCLIEDLSP